MPKEPNQQYKTICDRIKQFRIHLGLSQKEFAELFDLDQTVISAMEIGRQDIRVKYISILINYGLNPNWLLLNEGPMIRQAASGPSLEVRQAEGATEYIIRVGGK